MLPAKTMFEQTDVIGAYWHPYIQLKQKMHRAAGRGEAGDRDLPAAGRAAGLDAGRARRDEFPDRRTRRSRPSSNARLAPFAGLTLERLRRGPGAASGHRRSRSRTSSSPRRRARSSCSPTRPRERWGVDRCPAYAEPDGVGPAARTAGGRIPLHFMTPNTKNRIHSQFNNLQMIRAVEPGRVRPRCTPTTRGAGASTTATPVRVFNDRGELRARGAPRPRPEARVRVRHQRLVDHRGRDGELLLRRARDRHGPRRGVPRQPGRGRGRLTVPNQLRLRPEPLHRLPGLRLACTIENDLGPGSELARAWRPSTSAASRSRRCFTSRWPATTATEPACMHACPALAYRARRRDRRGARSTRAVHRLPVLLLGLPLRRPAFEPDNGVMGKCTFCSHRLAEGLAPACARCVPPVRSTTRNCRRDCSLPSWRVFPRPISAPPSASSPGTTGWVSRSTRRP